MPHPIFPVPQRGEAPRCGATLLVMVLLLAGCDETAPRDDGAAVDSDGPIAAPPAPEAAATAAMSANARPARWAVPAGIPGLENAWRVSPILVRAEQPTEAGLVAAQAAGIRTVIDLRAFHDDHALATAAGLRFIHVRMNTWHAEDEDVIRVMAALGRPEEGPYLIHCQHGSDRTGTMVAMYRMVWQGWSRADAIDEMQHGGYGFHPMWTNLIHYLENVDIDAIRSAARARIAAGQD